uniref:Acireductone dioxygenase n=1 Tax=Ascaris lumbricoides TaxID=6252 RepID=A0A0M3I8S4_ASCLU
MVRAWLMCRQVKNQSAPCNCDPPIDVSSDELYKLGILTQYIPVVDSGLIDKMCDERGYKYRDELIISRERMPNYDEEIKKYFEEHMHIDEEVRYILDGSCYFDVRNREIKKYFEEHMHIDEEVRYILDGSCYFDVRNREDKWVRIAVEPGDAIILPPGIFHRFTPDHRDYIQMLRLFKEQQEWLGYNRNEMAKVTSVREQYLKDYIGK